MHHQYQLNVRIDTNLYFFPIIFQVDTFYLFPEIAQDRFVPRESTDHFIEKNKRNRVKSSPNIRECKYHSTSHVVLERIFFS